MANCKKGLGLLQESTDTTAIQCSPFYQTEPVDFTDQDWFVNSAARVETAMKPLDLLKTLQNIQHQVGRSKDTVRFGPRILDMDIIFYDALVLDSPELVIPHPRMHKRRFVLEPICDIDPNIVHPLLQKTVQEILDDLDTANQKVIAIE